MNMLKVTAMLMALAYAPTDVRWIDGKIVAVCWPEAAFYSEAYLAYVLTAEMMGVSYAFDVG